MLQDVRTALDKPGCIPLDYSLANPDIAPPLPPIQEMRELARAFLVEAAVAEREDRYADAARSSMDIVRIGRLSGHGGLVVDSLVGVAIEAMGTNKLRDIRENLTADDCRGLVRRLEDLDTTREPASDVYQRDKVCSEHVYGWPSRLYDVFHELAAYPDESSLLSPFSEAIDRSDARNRLLMTELAIRAYRLEHGGNPERLEQLVPEYLARVPIDPYSGEPLVYRRRNGEYVLYGVGPNRKDDGGEFLTWDEVILEKKGDLFLDTKSDWDEEPEDENGEEDEEQEDAEAAPSKED